jgi:CrcB protein
MLKILSIGAGGFVGALARYWLSGLAQNHIDTRFPIGTLLVNVLGCLLIGALMSVIEDRQGLSPDARLFLVTGILGAFTTFSTMGYETVELLRDRSVGMALAYVAGNLFLGIGAVVAGRAVVRLVG